MTEALTAGDVDSAGSCCRCARRTAVQRLASRDPAVANSAGCRRAIISGFAFSPLTTTSFPEFEAAITHLREVLGEAAYESLALKGAAMTTAAIAAYAYNEIEQACQRLRP